MQRADDVVDIGLLAVLLQAPVDDVDGVAVRPVGVDAPHVDARPELPEHLAAHHFEALAGLDVLVRGLLAGDDGGVALEARRADHTVERCSRCIEEGPHQGDRLGQIGEQIFGGPGRTGLAAVAARSRAGEGRQRLAQVLEDAAVIHDQAVVLARVHPVGAGDGLHQRMGLEGFVEIEGGEARYVEAGEPHGADHGDAEGVLLLPEGVVERHPPHVAKARPVAHGLRQAHAFLDQPSVRNDVETPLAELLHLALLLAHHHRHAGLAHPGRLAAQEDRLCSSALRARSASSASIRSCQ